MKRIDTIERPAPPESPDHLPPGRYWVGDPCYAITNDGDDIGIWFRLCDDMFAKEGGERGAAVAHDKESGFWFVASSTAHGDGTYEGSDGRTYGVDAGMIGVVPEFFWGEHRIQSYWGGDAPNYLVDFPEPFSVSYEKEDGRIIIGHIEIVTDYSDICIDCGEKGIYSDDLCYHCYTEYTCSECGEDLCGATGICDECAAEEDEEDA